VPTGKIDDADNTHSDDIQTPQKKQPIQVQEPSINDKVANMQGRSNPEIAPDVVQSILKAKTQEDLKSIWEANKDLHTEKKFVDAIGTRKKELLDNK
jgi:hypothetical protein